MDLGTIIGLVLGFGLIGAAMMIGGGIMPFMDAQSALIVIGAIKVGMQAFFDRSTDKTLMVPLIIDLAAKARKEGLVALEGEQIDDPFMARGVRLGVDGLSPELIKETLTVELSALKDRHDRGQRIFKFM